MTQQAVIIDTNVPVHSRMHLLNFMAAVGWNFQPVTVDVQHGQP